MLDKRVIPSCLLAFAALIGTACDDLDCPKGYTLKGDTCYRNKDGGVGGPGDASERALDASSDPAEAVKEGGPEADDASEEDAGGAARMDSDTPTSLDGDAPTQPTQQDDCVEKPCLHGGKCSTTAQGPSCDCTGTGYEGTTCQTEMDECASANSCTNEAYPCVQTEPPGYTCQGQFADWPMPDAVAGSKTKPSYTASHGVVLDNVTGLAWQQDPPTTFHANDCAAGDGCTWEEAKAYCDRLVISSYRDFRLPTKIELESIIDDTRSFPSLDPGAFPNAIANANANGSFYWTASYYLGHTGLPWVVGFTINLGVASAPGGSTNTKMFVRCVQTARRVPSLAIARYTAASSASVPAVTDARTGLIWQQPISSSLTLDAGGSKTYCSSLGSGWRLPTKKELLTLLHPTIAIAINIPAIDPIFTGAPADLIFWSSSPLVAPTGASSRSWTVSMTGATSPEEDTKRANVRCVR